MVKGTNRTVIEINDTGNKMFEKVILFVSAEYGNISSKKLKEESLRMISNYQITPEIKTIRQYYKRRRLIISLLLGVLLLAIISAIILIF